MADSRLSDLIYETTNPADADLVYLVDVSAASEVESSTKLTWSNIKATLKTYFDTLYSKALNVYSGSGNFNGSVGVSVNIGSTLSGTDYVVGITPTADAIDVGPFWVNNKSTSTFMVYNWGSSVGSFDWILVDNN